MYYLIILIIIVLFITFFMKRHKQSHTDINFSNDNDYDYNRIDYHFPDIIPDKNMLIERLRRRFILSTYEDYDVFILLLEDDMMIHHDEDFVFYNSTWRYHPWGKNKLPYEAKFHFSNSTHQSVPASLDGSIIIKDENCFPNDCGIEIDLNRTKNRISHIIFLFGEYPFTEKMEHCVIRLSDDLISWAEDKNGIDNCFLYKELEFSGTFPVELCCTLDKKIDGQWEFSTCEMGFNSIEEVINKYISNKN